jgi:hypothetical protein
MLYDLVQRGGESGLEEMVIGMAHRGRLNVLVNVLGKAPSDLFSEFEGKYDTAHSRARATSSTTRASRPTCARPAATCTWRWPSILRISRS